MKELTEPSEALAEKALKEVGFEDRLIGYKHHQRLGGTPITLYSFEEVTGFLADSFPQIDYVELETWVRDVIGDRELAGQIHEAGLLDIADLKKCRTIAGMMFKRLLQYQRVSSPLG